MSQHYPLLKVEADLNFGSPNSCAFSLSKFNLANFNVQCIYICYESQHKCVIVSFKVISCVYAFKKSIQLNGRTCFKSNTYFNDREY